jgi:pimeloyl-ACP methyl ester carboxylesterase
MGSVVAKSIVEKCMQTTIYQPPPRSSYTKDSVQYIKSIRGDKLALRCISPPDACMTFYSKYRDTRHVVLYSHGNATDLGGCTDVCEIVAKMLDAHVVVYDYPNYGLSSKTAMSESVLHSSVQAVYDRLMEIKVPQEKIILMGHSLGSVPTLHIASRVFSSYLAVILICPLASAFRTVMVDKYFPDSVSQKFDAVLFNNLKAIENVHAPVAIVHGFDDDVIDISSAELLHSRIPAIYKFKPLYISAGHNDIYHSETLADVSTYLQEFMKLAQDAKKGLNSDALQD